MKTSSIEGGRALHGDSETGPAARAGGNGFIAWPDVIKFGNISNDAIYSTRFFMRNIGADSARFTIKQENSKNSCFYPVYIP